MPVLLPIEYDQTTQERQDPYGRLIDAGSGGHQVRRSILPGGIRVISESMPSLRSVSVGFWVGVGSRDETAGMFGSTHFLEHLLFKGTSNRSALEIAQAFDRVGGESNALTAKEHTCYYARVLGEDLAMAVDVLADMVVNAVLDPELMEQERGVILEEIAMDQDDPTDLVFENFMGQLMGQHPLGRPIGGSRPEIEQVSRQAVWEHYKKFYTPDRLVISAAGALEHQQLVDLVYRSLSRYGWIDQKREQRAQPQQRRPRRQQSIIPEKSLGEMTKGFEQANIVMGCPSLIAGDERRYAMSVLTAALGGGMSSRLFQQIREKRGLAYSTFAFSTSYADTGYFAMYAGCLVAKVEQVCQLMRHEFAELARTGLSEAELAKVAGQLSAATVMGSEDASSRMSRLGRAELEAGRYTSLDELQQAIRSVSLDEVQQLAAWLAEQQMITTILY